VINFPVITDVKVEGFGLYPGAQDQPGLSIEFAAGLTLILGTNGLGKSTLMQILYRCFTGPYDIPGLDAAAELGNMKTAATIMSAGRRNTFANRDALGAREAKVSRIGSPIATACRRLE
jgi:ABC-type polysaccharide/polyol phosphate transport system ATPase subunit